MRNSKPTKQVYPLQPLQHPHPDPILYPPLHTCCFPSTFISDWLPPQKSPFVHHHSFTTSSCDVKNHLNSSARFASPTQCKAGIAGSFCIASFSEQPK